MKVADLQRHLADLGHMLEAAGGAKSVAADLAAISQALQPFQEQPLKKFADFLLRAEALDRGAAPPPKATRTGAASSRQARPDLDTVLQEVQKVYHSATDPATTEADIESLAKRLEPLTKDGLMRAAAAIELRLKASTSKKDIIAAIHKRILERKSTYDRSNMLGRPTTPPEPSADAVDASAHGTGTHHGYGAS